MFLVHLSEAVYRSKRQSLNFREFTPTDQLKVLKKEKLERMEWCCEH